MVSYKQYFEQKSNRFRIKGTHLYSNEASASIPEFCAGCETTSENRLFILTLTTIIEKTNKS